MEVVLIKYKSRYEDCEEFIGVAENINAAKQHVEWLAAKYPDAYGDAHGRYYFEEHKVIVEDR